LDSHETNILRMSCAATAACRQLSCWQLLKMKALLREVDLETAFKHFKITINDCAITEEIDEEVETFVAYPLASAELANNYEQWKVLLWSELSHHDWMLGLLWAAVTVPLETVNTEKILSFFSSADEKAVSEAIHAICVRKRNECTGRDDRFDGPSLLRIVKEPVSYVHFDK
uniref:Dimer_Tnp_hAT domain-containing protein n=1 Tax=Gongylonema pulchrum TaxID=637853 RepID=A0A183E2Q9_9BILA